MTDQPGPDETSGDRHAGRHRLPRIDLVTLMLAILAALILLFLSAEVWLPHMGD